MIELLDAVISGKKAPKEPVTFSFEKGEINFIPFEEKFKFSFLMLKDQALDSGTFKINDYIIYPGESEVQHSLFFLTVNSLVKFHLCFVTEPKLKKEKVKFVQEQLITLRELPTETAEEKNAKISAIFNKVVELEPAYLLLDFNDAENSNFEFIQSELNNHKNDYPIIVLEQAKLVESKTSGNDETITDDFEAMDLSIGDVNNEFIQKETKKAKKITNHPKENGNFKTAFVGVFKENLMAFLSFIVPALGVIAFVLLSPLYAQTNKVLLIPFIITITVCFVLFMLMTYKCTDFENRNQLIAYAIINSVSIIIAYGLSLGIYFVFLNFDSEIKALQSKNIVGFVVSIVMALVLITACLYLKPTVDYFKKLIKKK